MFEKLMIILDLWEMLEGRNFNMDSILRHTKVYEKGKTLSGNTELLQD